MRYLKCILIILIVFSCSDDDRTTITINNTELLSVAIEGRITELGSVIACAGNTEEDANVVEVYFYPEDGSTNFKLYETNRVDLDSNDFSNYREVTLNTAPFFNGSLLKFVRPFSSEQWFIVTYELDNEIKISNPIRTKNITQPTLFNNNISINQELTGMPIFNWEVDATNNVIFFQVLSTLDGGLLSGTYTIENQFQYYNTSNVVLNITQGVPPSLTNGTAYKFTVMDVSQDNWVNTFITSDFISE